MAAILEIVGKWASEFSALNHSRRPMIVLTAKIPRDYMSLVCVQTYMFKIFPATGEMREIFVL